METQQLQKYIEKKFKSSEILPDGDADSNFCVKVDKSAMRDQKESLRRLMEKAVHDFCTGSLKAKKVGLFCGLTSSKVPVYRNKGGKVAVEVVVIGRCARFMVHHRPEKKFVRYFQKKKRGKKKPQKLPGN